MNFSTKLKKNKLILFFKKYIMGLFSNNFKNNKSKMKKSCYLILSVFLGLLLSFIIHALAEIIYLQYAFNQEIPIKASYFLGVGWCALPVWSQYTFLLLGIFGGYFLGQYWWKLVYIQKRHWRFKKNKKTSH